VSWGIPAMEFPNAEQFMNLKGQNVLFQNTVTSLKNLEIRGIRT
jgi:hypothetical protein